MEQERCKGMEEEAGDAKWVLTKQLHDAHDCAPV